MTTIAPQRQVVMVPSTAVPKTVNPTVVKEHKKTLKSLAIIEVIFGALIVLFGIVIAADVARPRYDFGYRRYSFTLGEGIWGGIWILISGIIGIIAGGKKSNSCAVNSHMAFSILGSLFAACTLGLCMTLGFINDDPFMRGFLFTMSALAFISIALCIASASYCCHLNSSVGNVCCGGPCSTTDNMVYTARNGQTNNVAYTANGTVMSQPQPMQQQQQVFVQSATGYPNPVMQQTSQPGVIQYILQPQQQLPFAPMQQPVMYIQQPNMTAIGQPSTSSIPAVVNTAQQKQDEANQSANTSTVQGAPPSYSQ